MKGITLRLRRRILAVTITCFAVVLSGGTPGLAATGTAPALGAATEGSGPSGFVLATYNIRHALSDSVAASDLQRLADTGVDVIAMQEMGARTRRDAVRARLVDCESCEFRAYMPNGMGPGEVPFLFRASAFELVSSGTEMVSDTTFVGAGGAGPSTIGPKYLTYVQLRHRASGQDIYVINNHTVASIQGPDGGPNYGNPERLQLFRKHMDGLAAMVERFRATGAAVFAVGDFNVNYRRDAVVQAKLFPYYRMKQVGAYASYKFLGTPDRGTHLSSEGVNDTRLIDQVVALEHPAIAPVEQAILSGYSSDHRPLRVRYAVVTPPDAPAAVVAEPMERSAKVEWSRAADNGSAVTGYTVTTVQTGAQLTVPGTETSAVVPGLTSGSDYTFTVRATNGAGTGPSSLESAAVTPFAVPPETSITSGPATGSFLMSGEATFGYASSIAGSTFVCSLDGVELPCASSSVRLASLTPGTHEFTTTAVDDAGDIDPSPATRSWTVPVGSTTLRRSASWLLKAGAGYYTGAYAQATTRHAVVSREVSGMRRLALVATKAPGHGTVKVYLGSTLLKQVDLQARVVARGQVLPIAQFSTAQSGKVRVVVASQGKPVRLEGLGVATR
jgi:Fibronectin type III domain